MLLVELDRFMMDCTSRNLSRKTLQSYDQVLRLFIRYLSEQHGVTDVADVKPDHLRQYANYLRERGKYTVVSNEQTAKINRPDKRNDRGQRMSDTTMSNYLRTIKVFLRWLYRERIIDKNLAKDVPDVKPARKHKPLLSENELHLLFRAFDTSTFHGFRDWTITRLILDTGCRVGECLEIMRSDVHLRNHAILLRYTKNHKERFVYFSAKMGRNLKSWMDYVDRYTDCPWLFPSRRGNKMDIRNYEKALSRAARGVGLQVTPHQLRNNFAKYYLLNGGDWATLSRLLGHSSVEVTQKAYLDFTDREVGQKYQRHSPLNNLNL